MTPVRFLKGRALVEALLSGALLNWQRMKPALRSYLTDKI